MVQVWVSGDENELKQVREKLGEFQEQAPAVLAKAINAAANRTRKAIVRYVTERYAIEEKDLRKAIHGKKATAAKPSGQIRVRGGRLPLSYFTTDPAEPAGNKPRFYAAALLQSDGLKPITGGSGYSKGFLVRFESGHKAMVERKIGAETQNGKEKLLERMGLSFAEMTGQREVIKAIQEEGYNELYKQIDKQVQRILNPPKKRKKKE